MRLGATAYRIHTLGTFHADHARVQAAGLDCSPPRGPQLFDVDFNGLRVFKALYGHFKVPGSFRFENMSFKYSVMVLHSCGRESFNWAST